MAPILATLGRPVHSPVVVAVVQFALAARFGCYRAPRGTRRPGRKKKCNCRRRVFAVGFSSPPPPAPWRRFQAEWSGHTKRKLDWERPSPSLMGSQSGGRGRWGNTQAIHEEILSLPLGRPSTSGASSLVLSLATRPAGCLTGASSPPINCWEIKEQSIQRLPK